jgi:purine catabolism regulator
MEITLSDLLNLEPGLVDCHEMNGPAGEFPPADEVEISWAVTARGTAPHLPHLRGGEIVLVSARVAAAVASDLAALVREAALRNVSAIVLERGIDASQTTYPGSPDVRILRWQRPVTPDTEPALNRLLTEQRGMLYRVGSELERQLTDLAVNQAGLGALVRVVAEAAGLPLEIRDARGRVLASAEDVLLASPDSGPSLSPRHIERALPLGARLSLGPLLPEQLIVARFLIDRITGAAAAALQRDNAARPRGSHRAEAIEALLTATTTSAADRRTAALGLGLDPDGLFLVAVHADASGADITRALSSLGEVHPTAPRNGRHMALVAAASGAGAQSFDSRISAVKRRWQADHAGDCATLAFSGPARGITRLPHAAREAQCVAALQARGSVLRNAVSFDSVDDVGALPLLYQLHDSTELRTFIADVLGALIQRDRRGSLRATLKAYLDAGGSHVDASSRLGIHRNTLAYRLRRIGELVGKDVTEPASWTTLHLALLASEMLDVCADDLWT